MKPSTEMPSKSYPSTGLCPFCLNEFGPVKFTEEHVIPYALNGRYVLVDGTCTSCNAYAAKTYEQKALDNNLLVPRLLLELRRRRAKKKPPKKFPPVSRNARGAMDSEAVFDIECQLAQYPKSFCWLVLPIPGKLGGPNRTGVL